MLLVVDESDMSVVHWWYDFDRGKPKYWEKALQQFGPCGISAGRSGTGAGSSAPPPPYTWSPYQTSFQLSQVLKIKKK